MTAKKRPVGRPKSSLTETMFYRCSLKERLELEDAAIRNERTNSEEARARCFPREKGK